MNIAEVGVWQGEGAKKLVQHWPEATLWLFDSFMGHDQPCSLDDAGIHPRGRYSDTSVEAIRAMYPDARIIPGYLPATLIAAEGERFTFVRIDVDHFYPTLYACQFFKVRMEPGGIIEFDDYRFNECPGATKAIDEVFGRENVLAGVGNFPTNSYHWVAP